MKISQMKTKEHRDEMAEVLIILSEFAKDKELSGIIVGVALETQKSKDKGDDIKITNAVFLKAIFEKSTDLINVIFKNNFDNLCKLISIIEEKPLKEIEEQSMLLTLKMGKDAFADKDLVSFFMDLLQES